jgi:hypothetical protein
MLKNWMLERTILKNHLKFKRTVSKEEGDRIIKNKAKESTTKLPL